MLSASGMEKEHVPWILAYSAPVAEYATMSLKLAVVSNSIGSHSTGLTSNYTELPTGAGLGLERLTVSDLQTLNRC